MYAPAGPVPRRFPRPVAAAALVLWAAVVVGGFGFLFGYAGRAGASGAAPGAWPSDSALLAGEGREVLVFVHPSCPCTHASLEALDRTLQRAGGRTRTRVIAVGEHGGTGRILARAAAIEGAERVDDPLGDEVRRFGVATSGHVLAYVDGALVFSGGVTPARGHEGSGSGCGDLVAALEGRVATPVQRPVYGCGLIDPAPAEGGAP